MPLDLVSANTLPRKVLLIGKYDDYVPFGVPCLMMSAVDVQRFGSNFGFTIDNEKTGVQIRITPAP